MLDYTEGYPLNCNNISLVHIAVMAWLLHNVFVCLVDAVHLNARLKKCSGSVCFGVWSETYKLKISIFQFYFLLLLILFYDTYQHCPFFQLSLASLTRGGVQRITWIEHDLTDLKPWIFYCERPSWPVTHRIVDKQMVLCKAYAELGRSLC